MAALILDEIAFFYKGQFKQKAIEAYWYNDCETLRAAPKASRRQPACEKADRKAAGKRAGKSLRAPSSQQVYDETEVDVEVKASKPRLYVANCNSTEEIAFSMRKGGWYGEEVGDAKNHHSILVAGGRKVNPLSGATDAPELPMGLRVRAEELGQLLEGLILAGGEGDFPGIAFAFLPDGRDVEEALMDALGVRKAARREVILEEVSWDKDFTDQQLESDISRNLFEATELLKGFGTSWELNFTESVTCAPVLYFAQSQSSYSSDRPILGVLHTRVWH